MDILVVLGFQRGDEAVIGRRLIEIWNFENSFLISFTFKIIDRLVSLILCKIGKRFTPSFWQGQKSIHEITGQAVENEENVAQELRQDFLCKGVKVKLGGDWNRSVR